MNRPSRKSGDVSSGGTYDLDVPDLPVHYLYRSPSPVWGIVTLMFAFVLVAFAIVEIRNSAPKQAALTVTAAGMPVPDNVPVLSVTEDSWTINDQPIQESDLLFRLSAQASQSSAIVIEHSSKLSADRLARALEFVNRAGFGQVGLRSRSM